jgi:phage/plasmid-like protein (TIGR03299 family)
MEHLSVIGGSSFANTTLTETSSMAQWAKDADLEWSVKSSPLMFDVGLVDENGMPLYKEDDSRKVLYRSDTHARLGVVSQGFNAVQPSQVLGFYQKISNKLNTNLEAAGWVKNGAMIWGLAKIGDTIRIKGQDEIRNYLMFSTANDGTKATTVQFISKRIVCNNMLNYAFNQEKTSPFLIRIPHMQEITEEKEDMIISEIISGNGVHWKNFESSANEMAETGIKVEDATKYFVDLLSIEGANNQFILPKSKDKVVLKLIDIYQNGVGQDTSSARNTLWGAVNAVSRYTDHEINYHSSRTAIANSQFGTGNNLKNKAFQLASNILKVA